MDKSNNKRRILALIEILRKKTDENTHLKIDDLVYELNKKGIEISNRKTLYDDFKVLNDFGYNVEYDKGYYLIDAPFNISEIKIIQDSLGSLKILDQKFFNDLNNKLYKYISDNDEKILNELSYISKHSDSKLLQHMEDIILAIKNKTSIIVKTVKGEDELFPVFLYRGNDYYYFYYHYPQKKKLYLYRFDNIKNIKHTSNIDDIVINKREILKKNEESSKLYSQGESEVVNIKLLNNDEKIIHQFMDDFPSAIHTNDGFSLKANINNVFFSKLVLYGKDIVITNKNISKQYINYLKEISKLY